MDEMKLTPLHYIALHDMTLHLLQPGRVLQLGFASTVGQTGAVLEHRSGHADGLFGLPLCFEEEDAVVEVGRILSCLRPEML
jgi:hypothetical protein